MAAAKAPAATRRAASLAALHWIAFHHRSEMWEALRKDTTAFSGISGIFGRSPRGVDLYNETKEDKIREFVQHAGLSGHYQRERQRYLEGLLTKSMLISRETLATFDRPPILPIYIHEKGAGVLGYAHEEDFDLDASFEVTEHFAYNTTLAVRVNKLGDPNYAPATRTQHISLTLIIDSQGHHEGRGGLRDSFYGVGRHRAESISSLSMANEHAPFLLNGAARILRGYGIPEWSISWNFETPTSFGKIPTEAELRRSLEREGFFLLDPGPSAVNTFLVSHPMMQEGSTAQGLVGLGGVRGGSYSAWRRKKGW